MFGTVMLLSRVSNSLQFMRRVAIDLFEAQSEENLRRAQPLAARMRPRTLDEYVGQEHILGEGKLLRRLLQSDRISSVIFYGPPGTGKTTLASVIANHTRSRFVELNAVTSGVKEVRTLLEEARRELEQTGNRTIVFIDELHRFNRSQQDVLLPDVEEGRIILIGATTQNPFFALISPLLSRSQVFQFQPLDIKAIRTLIERALNDHERGLGNYQASIAEDALQFLAEICDGDGRRALNALEIAVRSTDSKPLFVSLAVIQESIQRKAIDFDPTGDTHYDVISAFIKSMRGSDANAAIYWLARMLESGEDPRFIARRIVICASEDVGNADPQALVVATAALQALEFVGMPECQLALAQAVTYIATAPKSNASTLAIGKALDDVKTGRTLEVPTHLRDGHYAGAKQLGHGIGYKYAHDHEDGFVVQDYLPEARSYYEPVERGFEKVIGERMREWNKRRDQSKTDPNRQQNKSPSE